MDLQGTLVTAASNISGFGVVVIAFRLERELKIEEQNQDKPEQNKTRHWIPIADWLVIAAILMSFTFVVVPLVSSDLPSERTMRFASGVCSATAVMVAGYIPAILAHYNFIYGLKESRTNPTLWEAIFVFLTLGSAGAAFWYAFAASP
jgi:hypothetical protein